MSEPSARPGPNPRLALGLLAVIFVLQGFYAGVETIGDGIDTGRPVSIAIAVAYVVYVGLIAAFAFGIWRRTPWARLIGMVAAALGLAITGLQILDGEPVDSHFLGIIIDGALLYYLTRPNIRELFEA
jgi:hypothetical protein